jgi:hypothetical protein
VVGNLPKVTSSKRGLTHARRKPAIMKSICFGSFLLPEF